MDPNPHIVASSQIWGPIGKSDQIWTETQPNIKMQPKACRESVCIVANVKSTKASSWGVKNQIWLASGTGSPLRTSEAHMSRCISHFSGRDPQKKWLRAGLIPSCGGFHLDFDGLLLLLASSHYFDFEPSSNWPHTVLHPWPYPKGFSVHSSVRSLMHEPTPPFSFFSLPIIWVTNWRFDGKLPDFLVPNVCMICRLQASYHTHTLIF